MRLDVFFRSCSRIYGLHGNRRIVNCTKTELIHRCLNSLIRSLNLASTPQGAEFSLTVIDDHSDSECLETIEALLKTCKFSNKLIQLEETGNGASLRKCYTLANEGSRDLIYFVEDDYLHSPEAIREMLSAHQQFSGFLGQDVILHPCDDAQAYLRVPSASILISDRRHWRALAGTTATLLITQKTFQQHYERFDALTGYDPKGGPDSPHEGNTINLIYKTVPCLGPMPALAAHMYDTSTMPAIADWIDWWQLADLRRALPSPSQPIVSLAEPSINGTTETQLLVDDRFRSAQLIRAAAGTVQGNVYRKTASQYFYILKGAVDYYSRAAGSSEPARKTSIPAKNLLLVPALTEYAIYMTEDSEILCLSQFSVSADERDQVAAPVYP